MIESLEDRKARHAWRAAVASVVLNVIGMPVDLVSARVIPGMPVWPAVASMAVGAVLLLLLLARRRDPTVLLGSFAFLINALAIVAAFWVTSGYFAASGKPWVPFEANKLGALTVALLAPELWVGALSITLFAGSALVKFYQFALEVRARLPFAEPEATLAFGLFGLALLVYRLRQLAFERRFVRAQAEAEALEEVARSLLWISDLANTPLQCIELNIALIDQLGSPELNPFVDRIKRAVGRLRESSRLLASYETRLKWQRGDASFDPRRRLG